jgi:hypothetical protein
VMVNTSSFGPVFLAGIVIFVWRLFFAGA